MCLIWFAVSAEDRGDVGAEERLLELPHGEGDREGEDEDERAG